MATPAIAVPADVAVPTNGTTVGAPTITFATLLEPLDLVDEYNEAFIESGIPIQVWCCIIATTIGTAAL